MSTTFDLLKARAGAHVVAWAEISGLPWAFSDGFITETNKSTLFTDAYTPTLTFFSALEAPEYNETRSIELLTGKGRRGGFSLKLTDFRNTTYMDGFFTWLFGSERGTISRVRIAQDIGKSSDFTADWNLAANIGTNGVAADYYCGLETVNGTPDHAGTQLDNVTRSKYLSPCISHKQNSTGVFPELTDHPTVWRGRLVHLYLTFVAAGELAGGAASARSSAHHIVGILEHVQWDGEHWVLQCDSIDKLLDRECCKGLATARVSRLVPAVVGGFLADIDGSVTGYNTDAPALRVSSWNDTAQEAYQYDVYIPEATYSVDEFIEQINAKFVAGFNSREGVAWRGELSLALDGGILRLTYVTSAVAAEVQTCTVFFMGEFNTANGILSIEDYWGQIVADTGIGVDVTTDLPAASTVYEALVTARTDTVLSGYGGHAITVPLQAGPEDSSPSSFATQIGDKHVVCIESQSGRQFSRVISTDAANGTITLFHMGPDLGPHEGSEEHPIRITLVCWLSTLGNFGRFGPVGTGVMRLLLSTGESGFNDSTYDTLAEGIGIEWPHETPTASADTTASLLDLESFERAWADAAVYCDYIEDVLWKPFKFRPWLEARLAFFGYYLAVENGQLKARAGLTRLAHQQDASLTKSETIEGGVSFGQDAGVRGVRFVLGDLERGQPEYTRTFLLGNKADNDMQIREHVDRGVHTDLERLLLLAQNTLVEYGKEAWRYSMRVDRALLDVEPGMVISVSDIGSGDTSSFAGRGFPNPDGTRGLSAVRMLVLEAETDWQDGVTTTINLLHSKTKRGGYSASAWIVSHAGSPSVLTCEANAFSPTADGVDTSRFTVGDKVLVVAVNPTTTENGSQAFTIAGISGNTITLSGAIDTAGANAHFASGEPLALIHNQYQTASQTTTAKAWAHIGDSSGDIGDGGDACYQW